MSLLISHIRYSLMITMAASICVVSVCYSKINFKSLAVLLFFWFGFYTYYAQILSGVMTFIGVLISLLIIEVFRRKNKVFTAITISFGAIVTVCFCICLYLFFQLFCLIETFLLNNKCKCLYLININSKGFNFSVIIS